VKPKREARTVRLDPRITRSKTANAATQIN
jgi:hypothetical protein